MAAWELGLCRIGDLDAGEQWRRSKKHKGVAELLQGCGDFGNQRNGLGGVIWVREQQGLMGWFGYLAVD